MTTSGSGGFVLHAIIVLVVTFAVENTGVKEPLP
jgi:hypothetical protein